jgi:hypothetical protein
MSSVRVRFTQSARRHRVAAGRARQVIDSPAVTLTLPPPVQDLQAKFRPYHEQAREEER